MAETAAMEKIRESIQSFEEEYPGFRLDAADIHGFYSYEMNLPGR